MNTIESSARWVKYRLGLRDDSRLVVALRPAFNKFLNLLYGRQGLVRVLGGAESIRIRPAHRNFKNDYESELLRVLKRTVRPGDTVLEVGAHIGLFTVLMAQWVGPTGRVYAFEPSPLALAALKDHLILNGVADRVSIIPAAISDAPGKSFFYELGTSGRNTLRANYDGIRGAHTIEVEVTTLDKFCESRNIIPSLIKIDIEGFELHAIRGASQVILRHKPALVVEIHPMNWAEIGATEKDLNDMISDMGYRTTGVEEQRNPLGEYGHVILEPFATEPTPVVKVGTL